MNIKLLGIGSLGFFLAIAATSHAAIIRVTDAAGNSDFSIIEGTPSTDVYFRVSQNPADAGNTNIQSASLALVVGDGGPDNLGGVDVVPITALNYTGTGVGQNASIWDPAASLTIVPPTFPLPASSANIGNVNVTGQDTNVQFGPGVAGDVLVVWTLDTSLLTAGQSDSRGTVGGFLLDPGFGAPPATTATWATGGGGSAPIPLTFEPGTLSIAAVPEPGSFILLSVGAVMFIGARRFRRRRRVTEPS